MQIGGAGGTGGGGGGCIVVLTANFCAAFVDVVAKGQLFHDLMTDATDAFITDATDAVFLHTFPLYMARASHYTRTRLQYIVLYPLPAYGPA